MLGSRRLEAAALAVVFAMGSVATETFAQGFQQALPIPSTETKSLTAIQRLFSPPPPPTLTLFPEARDALRDTPAFLRDSKIEINARSYYRDHTQNGPARATLNEAWAAGGWATLETGKLFNLISGGTTFYSSLPLYAPPNAGNTGLLLPNQQGYAVVGELYGKLHLTEKHTFIAGRYIYDTPFLNGQDNRMTPNTFYGYALRGSFGDAETGPAFRYGGGYIAAMKPRDADVFSSMSRVAGANVDRGVGVGGGLFTWERASLGLIEYYSQDIINILYGEGKYGASLPYGIDAALALQYADQRATGANLLTGSYFSTGQFGARLQMGRDTGILTLAYTVVGPDYAMQSPWSFNPFYTDALSLSFQRAGESAVQVGLSYDFSPIGLKGVAAAAQYFRGWTAAAAVGAPLIEDEWDFNLEWRPDWKPISGLWLRARYGLARTNQNNSMTTQDELRLILNYKVELF